MKKVQWKDDPNESNFPAALSYLRLLMPDTKAAAVVKRLREDPEEETFKAKDILRAARLPLLPKDNPHVKAHLAKIKNGKPLSPILIVRGDAKKRVVALIADGYHRTCASYHTDQETLIPCRHTFL